MTSVTINLTGSNDAPTHSGPHVQLPNGTEDSDYIVTVAQLTDGYSDVDFGSLGVANLTANHGVVTDNHDGTFTISPQNNFNGAIVLHYDVTDGQGAAVHESANFQLDATNDAPTGMASAILAHGTEDTPYSVSAVDLLAGFSDADNDTLSVSGLAASNGVVVDNHDGTFTITPSQDFNGAVTLTYNVIDGNGGVTPATQTYTLDAVNDAAILSSASLNLTETDLPSDISASGQLSISDVDSPNAFQPQSGVVGDYGTFAVDATGSWTYVASSAHNEFSAGSTYTDSFQVTSSDGTLTSVTINIAGTNDAAVLSSANANLTETNLAADISTSGQLLISDVDSAQTFLAQSNVGGSYGSFSIDAAGAWTYAASSAHDAFQAGVTYTDSFQVTSADGTLTSVTVNIAGTNDAAVLSSALVDRTETDQASDLNASGQLSISDVDSAATFVAQTAKAGTYGHFSIDTAGAWTYTADTAHNEFAAGQTYTDSFTVASADGTTTSVAVNLHGSNDAAVLGSASVNLTEGNSAAAISTAGDLSINDVDSSATYQAQTNVAGSYGSFSINAAGHWTYTASSAHNEFVSGQTYSENFQVASADGTLSSVVIAIAGTNDSPDIAGDFSGAVQEDTTFSATGQLSSGDTDQGATTGWSVLAPARQTYGSFVIDGTGHWTYALDNSAAQGLTSADHVTEFYTVKADDGLGGTDTQVITINITGLDEAPSGIVGTPGNDPTLTGTAASENIYGLAGDDVISGLGSADNIFGGDGNDLIYGGAGNDIIDGGAGIDTASYAFAPGAVTVSLVTGGVGGEADGDQLSNVENLIGSAFNDTLIGNAGDNVIAGGAGADIINGGLGNDTVDYSTSSAAVTINLGTLVSGVVKPSGGDATGDQLTSIENVTGSAFADKLTGNAGVNVLTGGAGNDILDGAAGADVMYGGDGDDTYTVDNVGDQAIETSALGGVDTVKAGVDFTIGANIEKLTLTGTGNIVGTGNELDNTIIGNAGNNTIYGMDGADTVTAGDGADTVYGGNANDKLDGGNGDDFLYGDAGDDNLIGNAGNDHLYGGVGTDSLDGGLGADVMDGGDGNDTYTVDNIGDVAVETNIAGGTDLVKASVNYTIAAYVENLTLTGTAAINGTGNELNNALVGNAGDNILSGMGGVDTITAGDGNDTVYGGDGADKIDAGSGNDVAYGDAGDDTVNGLAGNDTLYGGEGGDKMDGGDGADLIHGDAGNDTIAGSAGIDILYGDAGDDTLSGGTENDTLYGGDGFDKLDGGAGADTLVGGDGNDTYTIDNVGDVIVETSTGGATDTALSSVTYTISDNVEDLTLTGALAIDGTGNGGNNALTGNAAANVLSGLSGDDIINAGAGNDTLYGGAGSDKLSGQDGNDILVGGANVDTLTGGNGADTFVFTGLGDSSLSFADTITDFVHGTDKIDLSNFDIDPVTAGFQGFTTFMGSGNFDGHAGELRYGTVNGVVMLLGDVNGDGLADFAVKMASAASLSTSDFIFHP